MKINESIVKKSSAFLFLTLSTISVILAGKPAMAGCGFLDITCNPSKWESPFPKPSKPTESTVGCPRCSPSQPTPRLTTYTIVNRSNLNVIYSVNGQNFSLRPGYIQTINATLNPNIDFDASSANGYQGKVYSLAGGTSYKFVQVNNSVVDLVRN